MRIKVLNNWKYKRSFSYGFWYRKGNMYPWPKRKFLQFGLLGFIFMIQWGSFSFDN